MLQIYLDRQKKKKKKTVVEEVFLPQIGGGKMQFSIFIAGWSY